MPRPSEVCSLQRASHPRVPRVPVRAQQLWLFPNTYSVTNIRYTILDSIAARGPGIHRSPHVDYSRRYTVNSCSSQRVFPPYLNLDSLVALYIAALYNSTMDSTPYTIANTRVLDSCALSCRVSCDTCMSCRVVSIMKLSTVVQSATQLAPGSRTPCGFAGAAVAGDTAGHRPHLRTTLAP